MNNPFRGQLSFKHRVIGEDHAFQRVSTAASTQCCFGCSQPAQLIVAKAVKQVARDDMTKR
jgi:hypothetical protein